MKKWSITIKRHFEILSVFFFKSDCTYMVGPPTPVRFCSLFNDPHKNLFSGFVFAKSLQYTESHFMKIRYTGVKSARIMET